MNLQEDIELLESLFVEMDPLTDGVVGVLLEIDTSCKREPPLPATGSSGSAPKTRI